MTRLDTLPEVEDAELTRKAGLRSLGIPDDNAPIVVCYGGGVDSTAMLVAMKNSGVTPDLVMFADTGGEKPETVEYIHAIDAWLESWRAPNVTWVRKKTTERVRYSTLEGNCLDNETLPSLAFGLHSCSLKWKVDPQDQFLKGVRRGPNKRPGWGPALDAWACGKKPIKLIGYDASPADERRRKKVKEADEFFRYRFPLQVLKWTRDDCIRAIIDEGLEVPIKSACFFCPASHEWELWRLAGTYPELFLRALKIERTALEGRHSRWDKVEFGGSWWTYIENGKQFPREALAGLGRRFSWNQWAVENGVVNLQGEFIADPADCLTRAYAIRRKHGEPHVPGCNPPS